MLGEVRHKPTRSLAPLDSPLNNNRQGSREASRNVSPSPGVDGRTSSVASRRHSSPRGNHAAETSRDKHLMTSVGPGVASRSPRRPSRSPAPNEMLTSVGPGLEGLAAEKSRTSHRSSSRGGHKGEDTLGSSQSLTSIGPGLGGISSRNRSSSRDRRPGVNTGETDHTMTSIGPGLGSLSRDPASTRTNDSFKSGKSAVRASHSIAGMIEGGPSALSSLRSEHDMPAPSTEVSAVTRPSSAARSPAPASLESGPGSLSSLRRNIHENAMEGLSSSSRSPSLLRGHHQAPGEIDDRGSLSELEHSVSDGKKKKKKKEKKEKKKKKKDNKTDRDSSIEPIPSRSPNSSITSFSLGPPAVRGTRPMSAGLRNKNSSPMPPKQDLHKTLDTDDESEDSDTKTKTKETKTNKKDELHKGYDNFDESASLQSSNFSDLDGGGSVMMHDHAHAKKKKKNIKRKDDRKHEEHHVHGHAIEDSGSISDFIPEHFSKGPPEVEQPHKSKPTYSKDNTGEARDCSIAPNDEESDSMQDVNVEDNSRAPPRVLSPNSSVMSDEDPSDLTPMDKKPLFSGNEVAPQQGGHIQEDAKSVGNSGGNVEGSNGFANADKVGDRRTSIARFLISFVPPTIAAEVETDKQKNVFRVVVDTKLSFLAASGNSSAGIQYLAGKILEDDFGLIDNDPESGHWRDMRRQVELLLQRLVAKGLPVFRVIHSQGAEVTSALESDPSGERFRVPTNTLVLARERRRRPDGWWIRLAGGGGWLHEVTSAADARSERVRFAVRCNPSEDEVRRWQENVGKIKPVANGNVLARNVAAVAKQMGLHSKKKS